MTQPNDYELKPHRFEEIMHVEEIFDLSAVGNVRYSRIATHIQQEARAELERDRKTAARCHCQVAIVMLVSSDSCRNVRRFANVDVDDPPITTWLPIGLDATNVTAVPLTVKESPADG